MPFSKRPLTWNEEVFAGLFILVLIAAGLAAWFLFKVRSNMSTPAPSQSVVLPPWNTMTTEEKLQFMAQIPQPENALSPAAQLELMKKMSEEEE